MSASSAAIVIVMGVSGSGKTTLARALEAGHGFRFLDADDFHPAANVEKMRAGIALDDADRMPWLSQLARLLEDAAERGQPTVLACSALKARYREALAITGATVLFVHLHGDEALLRARGWLSSGTTTCRPRSCAASWRRSRFQPGTLGP